MLLRGWQIRPDLSLNEFAQPSFRLLPPAQFRPVGALAVGPGALDECDDRLDFLIGRSHRRSLWPLVRDFLHRRTDVSLRPRRRRFYARAHERARRRTTREGGVGREIDELPVPVVAADKALMFKLAQWRSKQ